MPRLKRRRKSPTRGQWELPTTARPFWGKTPASRGSIIPVFPGNNCEFDSAAAFRRAGAVAETLIVNNLSPQAVAESVKRLAAAIDESQIVMIPGGFSGGDEPDGLCQVHHRVLPRT